MRYVAAFGFIVAVILTLLMSTPSPAQAEAVPIRGWQFHHYDANYLSTAIPVAAQHGINHIQLSHDIVHDIEDLFDDPERVNVVNDAVALCHKHGIKVFLWTHELNQVDLSLVEGGKVDLDRPELWNCLRDKYRRAFQLTPDIDGLILTFHETDVSVYEGQTVRSKKSPAERVTELINVMHNICASAGKELFVRTFIYWPEELDLVVEGIRASHTDVRVMTKCVPHDWNPSYPNNPALGCFPERIQIVELDPAAEYYGKSLIPFNQVGYMKRRLDYALQEGTSGAVIRVDRKADPILGTMNEVNTYAFSRFMQDMSTTPDTVWKDWTTSKFGSTAGPAVERAYRRTFDIITNMYLVLGFYFLNNHSEIPDLSYASSHIVSHSVAKWDAAYKSLEDELLKPTEETLREALAEKAKSVKLTEQSLRDIDEIRDAVTADQFRYLRAPLEKFHRCAVLWEALTEVYLRYRMALTAPTRAHVDAVEAAATRAEQKAAQIELEAEQAGVVPDGEDMEIRWESAKLAQDLIDEIRRAVAILTLEQQLRDAKAAVIFAEPEDVEITCALGTSCWPYNALTSCRSYRQELRKPFTGNRLKL